MQITKFEHSGLAITKNGQTLLFDPVEFTTKMPDFTGVVGIIITHSHGDHCQPAEIARILAANPTAEIITTEDNLTNLINSLQDILATRTTDSVASAEPTSTAFNIKSAKPGDEIKIGDFSLKFFGGNHAAIIPGHIPCQNLGVVVDSQIINPGDSFDISGVSTKGKILLAPAAAPWCKVSEVADFITKAHPAVVIPIHDAVLSSLGRGFTYAHLASTCHQIGAEFVELDPGQSYEA